MNGPAPTTRSSRSTLSTRTPGTRMSAEERREHVLEAATRAFARGGYAGTSTDAVAREAGVSQPYVVRIFGSKQELFLQVFDRAGRRVDEAFAAVLETEGFDAGSEEDRKRLGDAYTGLLEDRDLMLCLMHGFTAGDHEEIGALGRTWMSRIFSRLREHGMSEDDTRDFIAYGMLLNVLMAVRVPEHAQDDSGLTALATCVFGGHLEQFPR